MCYVIRNLRLVLPRQSLGFAWRDVSTLIVQYARVAQKKKDGHLHNARFVCIKSLIAVCQVPACCGNMLLEHKEVLQGNHNNITKIMFQVYLATVMLSGLQIHSLMIVVSVFIKTQNTLDSCTLPDCTDAEIHDTSLNRFFIPGSILLSQTTQVWTLRICRNHVWSMDKGIIWLWSNLN